jgi:TnpA family transposase
LGAYEALSGEVCFCPENPRFRYTLTMPRRELLTSAERTQLLAFPDDEAELIRLATLASADLAFVRQRRGERNRLGIAVLIVYLRYGRILGEEEKPHEHVLSLLAAQLEIAPSVWELYAVRDETRREHLLDLLPRLGMEQFGRREYRSISAWVEPIALQTTRGVVLAQAVVEELRRRRIVLPPVPTIERLCGEVATRAQRKVFSLLTGDLSVEQRGRLDELLELRPGSSYSRLSWLRMPAGAPTAKAVLAHIERLRAVRDLGLSPEISQRVHQNRLLQLAREGAQSAVYQFKEYEQDRRHGTLVALMVETAATLTDEILELHDRLIGSFFTQAKNKYERAFAEQGKAINDKVRLYARIGSALVEAREQGRDAFQAIEKIVPWKFFSDSVREAGELARDENFNPLALITEHYPQLRRYGPAFLETFEFRPAAVAKDLIAAIQVLREMNRSGARRIPADAPVGFIRKRWAEYVFGPEEVDRRFYEICVMAELKNALRSGDVSVVGSRQFRNFDDFLMPRPEFVERLTLKTLALPCATSSATYLADRLDTLRTALNQTTALASAGELPDVELTGAGLKISPMENSVPQGADALRATLYRLIPHVKITDLLMEVDRWTGFTRRFVHLKTDEPAKDPALMLTALLADATNLGLGKMAESSPGISLARLSWLVAWHIRDETYSKGLAEIVNHHHRNPFASRWGEGRTSSSDGQRFRAGGRGEASGQVNPKYGNEPGVTFYTHISDQYAPFHTKVINAAVRDATHVLDGLLYHESDLRIEEHYTDTGGFTDHVFGLCHLLGFRFAPRIRDLADKKLYVPGKPNQWCALTPLIGGTINTRLIEQQLGEVLRLAASIQQGTVTASLILRKLGSYPRQNSLALALREIGRMERTLYMLAWLEDPTLRRRVTAGLNKGEARNSLARAIFFNRLGEVRDRSFENQRHRASGLNLVTAAITLWNTVYLERAVEALGKTQAIDPALLQHVSPLGWEHINLTGDYTWTTNKRVAKGGFRQLRTPRATVPNP